MATAALKANIIQQIKRLITEHEYKLSDDSAAARYTYAISLVLSKEQLKSKNTFLNKYIELLKAPNFPILKVDAVQLLYKKWSWHPVIFEEISLLQRKVKLKLNSAEFWKSFFIYNASDKADPNVQKARIQLIISVLNEVGFTAEQLEKYGIVCEALLKLNIMVQHHEALKYFLKNDPTHVFHTMVHLIKRSIVANNSPFDISRMIQKHYFQIDTDMAWSPELGALFDLLEQKLPSGYLLSFTRRQLGKIFWLYRANSHLFMKMEIFENEQIDHATLLRHLFTDFMISGSFLRNFNRDLLNSNELEWFKSELNGEGISSVTDLPLVLTKKAAHHFRMLPFELELKVTQSLVYSSIATQINEERFAFNAATALRDYLHLDFWITTMVALHKKGLLANQVMEMMDFIQQKVFVEQQQIDFRKRSLQRLLNEMQEWHAELRLFKRINKAELEEAFKQLDVLSFHMEIEQQKYLIRPLQKGIDLFHEGRILEHCVFSYRYRCFRGESYIFSLRKLDETAQETPLVTIEIVNNEVFQARGKFNRKPTDNEQRIINAWAAANEFIY